MARIPDYILDAVAVLVRPYLRSVDARRLRAAVEGCASRGVTCAEASRALGVPRRTIADRAARAGLEPVGVGRGHGGRGARYYAIEDLRRACGATEGDNATAQE